MKHDLRSSTDAETDERFRSWLEAETIDSLRRSYGDGESTKAAIFLFVNRAFESHMPEREIAQLFGRCIARAGYREQDEEPAYAWLEAFADVARGIYGNAGLPEQD